MKTIHILLPFAIVLSLTQCGNKTGYTKSTPSTSAIPTIAKVAPAELDKYHKAVFAAGCFWCEELVFESINGVAEVISGYAGGTTKNPTYEDVCSHQTGHAEVVEVEYDPAQISFAALLDVFWECHNPTTGNRQGFDFGDQYCSAVFFTKPEQESVTRASAAQLEKSGNLSAPVTTEIALAAPFYAAEDYHQNYIYTHGDNPYVQVDLLS